MVGRSAATSSQSSALAISAFQVAKASVTMAGSGVAPVKSQSGSSSRLYSCGASVCPCSTRQNQWLST